MAISEEQVRRMMALFRGHSTKSGTHGEPTREPDRPKWIIKTTAKTLNVEPTAEIWKMHLKGERPLGIIPITEDNQCCWGSIDLDEYDLDLPEVVDKILATELPLLPTRSKSGGLHVYGLFKKLEPAGDIQSSLRAAAAALGMARSEIFPKQVKLHDKRDAGSWMIMPYFGDGALGDSNDGTYGRKIFQQCGLKKRGAEMTLSEFLNYAEKIRTTSEELTAKAKALAKPHKAAETTNTASKKKRGVSLCDFSDGPPCLQHLCGSRPSDGRKTILINAATYMKRADPGGWADRLEGVNQSFNPALPRSEIDGVIKSTQKKNYNYQCNDEPLVSHCDSKTCRLRKFGVGDKEGMPTIALRKLDSDPVVWIVDVDGETFEMGTNNLLIFSRFQEECANKLTKIFDPIAQKEWILIVKDAMSKVEGVIPVPADLSIPEMFRENLEEFLTNSTAGETKDDLLAGKPWKDEENGEFLFTMRSLEQFFRRRRIPNFDAGTPDGRRLFKRLIRGLGGDQRTEVINDAPRSLWWVPSSSVKYPELSPPAPPDVGDEV